MYETTWTCPNCGQERETILSLGELETLQVIGAVTGYRALSDVN